MLAKNKYQKFDWSKWVEYRTSVISSSNASLCERFKHGFTTFKHKVIDNEEWQHFSGSSVNKEDRCNWSLQRLDEKQNFGFDLYCNIIRNYCNINRNCNISIGYSLVRSMMTFKCHNGLLYTLGNGILQFLQ